MQLTKNECEEKRNLSSKPFYCFRKIQESPALRVIIVLETNILYRTNIKRKCLFCLFFLRPLSISEINRKKYTDTCHYVVNNAYVEVYAKP